MTMNYEQDNMEDFFKEKDLAEQASIEKGEADYEDRVPKLFRYYSNRVPRISITGEFTGRCLKIATAMCNEGDQFKRKVGRAISEGRLKKNKVHTIVNLTKCDTESFINFAQLVIKIVNKDKITVPKEPYLL